MEILTGTTPDISMFRFRFWEPVWYYEPTARFPAPNFLPGRHIGIAWHHGDAFTYKIWTTPDGNWKDGKLLIRNVVKSRSEKENVAYIDYPTSALILNKKETKKRGRKRKRHDEIASDNSTELVRYENNNQVTVHKNVVSFKESPQIIEYESNDSEEMGAKTENTRQLTESTTNDNNDPLPNSSSQNHSSSLLKNSNSPISDDESETEADSDPKYDPLDGETRIEMVNEINDGLKIVDDEKSSSVKDRIREICDHKWKDGNLVFKVRWFTDEFTQEELIDMKIDYPRMTASYIVANVKPRSKSGRDSNIGWAKKVLRDYRRAIRRIARLYDFYLDEHDNIQKVRRSKKKKAKKVKRASKMKYGIVVPRNVKKAIALDEKNEDTYWQDAMKKEVDALVELDCFSFKEKGFNPGEEYQPTILFMVFDVKQDLRRKARLVAGGHLVDPLEHEVYSSTVKGISVRLLQVIAHKANYDILCGDVGNAFPTAYTNEKVYAIAGKEFGAREGQVIILVKALYGLATSEER